MQQEQVFIYRFYLLFIRQLSIAFGFMPMIMNGQHGEGVGMNI